MKHIIRLTALLAAVMMLAACIHDPVEVPHERDIVYTVDNHTARVHLTTEAEFDALLDRFCDYVEDGKKVSFYNSLLEKNIYCRRCRIYRQRLFRIHVEQRLSGHSFRFSGDRSCQSGRPACGIHPGRSCRPGKTAGHFPSGEL